MMHLTSDLGNNILLISSLALSSVYFLLAILNKQKRKHLFKYFIISIIIFSLINIYRIYGYNKKEQKEAPTSEKTTTTTITTKKEEKDEMVSSKGYKITYQDGAYYIDNYLIANKTYLLSSSFVPSDTYTKITSDLNGFCQTCINNEAYRAWLEMKADAASLNLNIWIQSGWRSYEYQEELYNRYVSKSGKEAADTYSARGGASEHQTGLAFDLNSVEDSFIDTDEGKWVNNNAYLYGYIIRFPKDKDNETGYKYEPWHIRYVGKELAKKLYNNGSWISMENYFGIESKYKED